MDERMKPIVKAERAIFRRALAEGNYWPTEFDDDLNLVTLAKIKTYSEIHPHTCLGKVNRYSGDEGKPYLLKYNGQRVYNFEWSFMVPAYDQRLIDLLKAREEAVYTGTAADAVRIEAIHARIDELGGIDLHWV